MQNLGHEERLPVLQGLDHFNLVYGIVKVLATLGANPRLTPYYYVRQYLPSQSVAKKSVSYLLTGRFELWTLSPWCLPFTAGSISARYNSETKLKNQIEKLN
jgi:hypothetical protein